MAGERGGEGEVNGGEDTHTCVVLKRFEPESFPLKYNPTTFEYRIHSVEVDLYYFKYI